MQVSRNGGADVQLFLIPLIALQVLAPLPEDPDESAMRAAFTHKVGLQVEDAIGFVAETGDAAGVSRIRQAHTERFSVTSFTKRSCASGESPVSFRCSFEVEFETVAGRFWVDLSGRFVRAGESLVYADEF